MLLKKHQKKEKKVNTETKMRFGILELRNRVTQNDVTL